LCGRKCPLNEFIWVDHVGKSPEVDFLHEEKKTSAVVPSVIVKKKENETNYTTRGLENGKRLQALQEILRELLSLSTLLLGHPDFQTCQIKTKKKSEITTCFLCCDVITLSPETAKRAKFNRE
jgi:hypothetical protein